MEDNLVRLLQGSIDATGVSALARQLGHGEGEIGSALSVVIPTFVSGLAHRATSPGGAAEIMSELDASDERILEDVPAAITHERTRLMDEGSAILNAVFGDKLGGVQSNIGSATGLGKGGAASLMRLHAPIAIATVARHYRGRIHSERELARELAAEGALAEAFLPRSIAPLLAAESARPAAQPTPRAVPSRKRGVPTTHAQLGATPGGGPGRREGGPGRFLIPAAIGAAILAAVLMFVGPRDRDRGTDDPALLGRPASDEGAGLVDEQEREEAREGMDEAGERVGQGAREVREEGREVGEETREAFREGGRAIEEGVERAGERIREAWETTEEAVEEGFQGARREGEEVAEEAEEEAEEGAEAAEEALEGRRALRYESSRFFEGQDTELKEGSDEAIDEIIEEYAERETDRVTLRGPNPSQLDSVENALNERGVTGVAKEVNANLDHIEVVFER
jgi:hypothetical protein